MKRRRILQLVGIVLMVVLCLILTSALPAIIAAILLLWHERDRRREKQQEDGQEDTLANAQQLLDIHGEPDDIILLDATRGNELDQQILVYRQQQCFLVVGEPLPWHDIRSITFNNHASPYEIPNYQVIITTAQKDRKYIRLSVGNDINWARDIAEEMERWIDGRNP